MTLLAQQTIWHAGLSAENFIETYFGRERSVLLIGGAGFDPRSLKVPERLSRTAGGKVEALFLREERSGASTLLKTRGDESERALRNLMARPLVDTLNVVTSDNTVVVGLRVVEAIRHLNLAEYDDIVLDMSALSIGASFPVAQLLKQNSKISNVHLMVWSNSEIDTAIKPIPGDTADPARGFDGDLGLSDSGNQPKIWLPQLAPGSRDALRVVRGDLRGPIEVCPILPISQRDPRAADRLAIHYREELESIWEVDARNLVYAMENDPLDLFRTISRINDRYTRVFEGLEKSHLVLTPSRNKVLAIGALLAAMEHGLAVRYVESVDYEVDWATLDGLNVEDGVLIHVWLKGDPYKSAKHAPESEND